MLSVVPPEMVARMSASPGARATQGGQFYQADLGKKFILGTVKAINETRLTIVRTDGRTRKLKSTKAPLSANRARALRFQT